MLPAHFNKGLVRALYDSLAADVDPRACRHLAVHHEPFLIELAEVFPVRPVRHQVRISDEHARCVRMCAKYTDRLTGLHQQRLVFFQCLQRLDDGVIRIPVSSRLTDTTVDNQVLRSLRNIRIQIVHQHAQWGFGQPTFCLQGGACRGLYYSSFIHRLSFSSSTTSPVVDLIDPGGV